MACRLKAKALLLSKISSESTAFPIYSITTTQRCKLVWLGMTSSINTASRPNLPNLIILNKILRNATSRLSKHTPARSWTAHGAPPETWFLCLLYSVYLLNHTAVESLGWRTPIKTCFGHTPDILSLLQFTFYEPIYLLDSGRLIPGDRGAPWTGLWALQRTMATPSHTGFLLTTINYLLAWWSNLHGREQEPNKWASTSTESKGSVVHRTRAKGEYGTQYQITRCTGSDE